MRYRVPSVPPIEHSALRTALARALVERARTTTEGFWKLTWMRSQSPARCLCTYRLCPHRYPVAADGRTVSALSGRAANLTTTSTRSTACIAFVLRLWSAICGVGCQSARGTTCVAVTLKLSNRCQTGRSALKQPASQTSYIRSHSGYVHLHRGPGPSEESPELAGILLFVCSHAAALCCQQQ